MNIFKVIAVFCQAAFLKFWVNLTLISNIPHMARIQYYLILQIILSIGEWKYKCITYLWSWTIFEYFLAFLFVLFLGLTFYVICLLYARLSVFLLLNEP